MTSHSAAIGTPAMMGGPIRVLLAKIGLDGHDRGVRIVAQALRDAGVEVIYVGPWAELELVVNAAVDEDVDVVGISSLAYDHLLVPALMEKLREAGFDGTVVVGGIIQEQDFQVLRDAGVESIFHPGDPLDEIVRFVRQAAATTRARIGM